MTKSLAFFHFFCPCFRSKNFQEGASELCRAKVFIPWLAHGLLAGGLRILLGGYMALTIIDGFAGTKVV